MEKKTDLEITNNYLALRKSIVKWLKEYLTESDKDGFVIGMSGGVDSSIIALLAKEAVDESNKKLLALILPIYNDYYDEKTAVHICQKFNIPCKVIDLASNYNDMNSLLNDHFDEKPTVNTNLKAGLRLTATQAMNLQPVVYTNLKARLRSAVIYFYANALNYLVMGTVNKGEFAIGYFPKNASAGDVLPVADLLKREVRGIGRSYGLSEEIINRKASGCIWAETAEEEWGFTEDELDMMLEALGRDEHALYDLILPKDKINKFFEAYQASFHKRRFYPIYKRRNDG